MKRLLLLLLIGLTNVLSAQQITIKGLVTDKKSGEALAGVSVMVEPTKIATITDVNGLFTLQTKEANSLIFTYIGYGTERVAYKGNEKLLHIYLAENTKQMDEVVIKAVSQQALQKQDLSVSRISKKELQLAPAIGGETDVLRTAQLMPGIANGVDGFGGLYVRGGNADQNLVLLDGATVYNPTHLIGFFSAFNSRAIQHADVYKGAFPAKFGSRVASIIDVQSKIPNGENINGTAHVGVLSSGITLDLPVMKKQAAVTFSARRSYISELFKIAGNELPYYFYDINAGFTLNLANNTALQISHYNGKDVLKINKNEQTATQFGTFMANAATSINLKQAGSNCSKHFHASRSAFDYGFTSNLQQNVFTLNSTISEYKMAYSTDFFNGKNAFKMGAEVLYTNINPNKTNINGALNEALLQYNGKQFNNFTAATFADYRLTKGRFNASIGSRISNYFGQNYLHVLVEPRLMLSYAAHQNLKYSLSLNRMSQPVHLINSSGILMPSDVWFPATKTIKPAVANQVAMGVDYSKNGFQLLVELYYKHMQNLVEYKEGTVVFLNPDLERELIQGKGKAYGFEVAIQKRFGKLTGLLSYTYSHALRQFDNLNNSRWFYARFDRRHDFGLTCNYEFTKAMGFNVNFIWATGSRVTPIVGRYLMPSASLNDILTVPVYGNRNDLVLANQFRIDAGFTYKFKTLNKWLSELQLGAYNLLNRTQPYRVVIKENNKQMQYQQLGLFGFVPSISYTLNF